MSEQPIEVSRTHMMYQLIVGEIQGIIKGTQYEGHVYTVGGCERDRLLGLPIKDIDLVVDLPNGGIEFARWLHENDHLSHEPVVYENYGTAMFRLKNFSTFELESVQTRKECYRDMTTRNPETAFGTIMEDCMRRDFTMNAIYRDVSTGELLDFTHMGLRDIENKIIRSCDDPNIIFKEDPLRILRAIRFQTKLGWNIEAKTTDGIINNVARLEIISRERITDEFLKILVGKRSKEGLWLIKLFRVLSYISPALPTIKPIDWLNAVNSLTYAASDDANVRLAVLFYYVDHTIVKDALRDMKLSNDTVDEIVFIINEIDNVFNLGDCTDANEIVELRKLQYRTKSTYRFRRLISAAMGIKNRDTDVRSEIDGQPMRVMGKSLNLFFAREDCFKMELPINGDDVMEYKGIKPGIAVKGYLHKVREACFKNPKLTREEAFALLDEKHV